MKLIDGKAVSAEIRKELEVEVKKLKEEKGITPGLAVVLVGEDPASKTYVASKEKACEKIGIYSEGHKLNADTSEEDLLNLIDELNNKQSIDGILVQLPLPSHIDEKKIINRINPEKDVDGFHPINVGKLSIGEEAFIPCTPHGVIKLMEHENIEMAGKKAVIIGRSNIVGKPAAMLLLQKNATVTICHSRTKDLVKEASEADILVAAIGKPNFVTADMVKEGAVVIDVGINRVDGKLVGDVDFESVKEKAGYITPVPGGVGPMTITMLLFNTVVSAKRKAK
ncbi:methylenetetrahydrofolate dehydrogenase (NADP+) / methenyltetrahydrofolate cyclohydrolase [Peptoclostridium litorale DSM 5388]|uniref:Bifunctional protein FolD n=1 Tax=Peptoclostridium litorale DSM 5388 TaxID=1121324 RepID=A0A069RCA0_PEPLI|nr:bifunctional methylenetetrahydrofolate dehydrogenase/methenyltetrahydrofolate cyclohydrolase FolD [Peptoclostridium litorale]KDR94413.1 bifunctional 5,10-methylene-tetrahydrofolate dehydrogenase / methenyl-tetrahydrofolate cyclohydrolase FolD [Peptoclostridium litorale DSM 5388]SIO24289.1 methylenetetrahydrofolate dehydrogenase (NADP+) / methenyltetrahydrofolate cyclohydrolase [Peptoclostridium litorale DSM 5388]